MNRFIPLMLSVLISNAYAAPSIPDPWIITEVQDSSKILAGYILHTQSATLIHGDSYQTDLQFVCSTHNMVPKMVLSFGPILPPNIKSKNIKNKVNDKEIQSKTGSDIWNIYENILFKDTTIPNTLTEEMTHTDGGIVSFNLDTEKEHWSAIFTLRSFTKKYNTFRALCLQGKQQ